MATIHRIFLPVDGYDEISWPLALQCAEQINGAHSPAIRDVVLLLHQQSILDHSTLAGFLGISHAKALRAGKSLGLPSGATLRLETKKTIRHFGRPTTIIAFYADDAILEIVDGLKKVAGVVAVEDLKGSAAEWKARWSPTVPGEAAKPPVELIGDLVIVEALKSLSMLINKGNGLLISRDQDWAKDVLRILRAKGHTADPNALKSWAIKNGWTPGAAGDLAKLAKKTFDMKTKPSLANIANANERYDRWCGKTPK
jgi:hypothetical protein